MSVRVCVCVCVCVKHVGRFIGEFEGDVMKKLFVDDADSDQAARQNRSLFHRSAETPLLVK